jgi:hypothetical protein
MSDKILLSERLLSYKQADADGVLVLVSRQLLHDCADDIEAKDLEIERLIREQAGFLHLSDMRQCMVETADENERLRKEIKQYEDVIIPSWKREEEMWREDEKNAIEFRRVLAEELDKRDADIARLRAWLRDYQPRPAVQPSPARKTMREQGWTGSPGPCTKCGRDGLDHYGEEGEICPADNGSSSHG